MKNKIENELLKRFNECCALGLGLSYRAILNIAYETASEKNQYNKCTIIQELIAEDIYN